MTFVKIHGTILDSSIWSESPIVCKVWITMLAMADEDGIVGASVDGLARRAVVPVEDCEAALSTFLGPDRFTRDGTSGERIEVVPGGWLVLNHTQYRDKRTAAQIATAERVRKHRELHPPASRIKQHRERVRAVSCNDVTPDNAKAPSEADTDTDTEAEKKKKKKSPPLFDFKDCESVDTPEVQSALADWVAYRKEGKKKLTQMTISRLPRRVLRMGSNQFIAAVAHTIDQGWTGLREPEQGSDSPTESIVDRMKHLEVNRD